MKPRLRSAPPTDEDLDTCNFRAVFFRSTWQFKARLDRISIDADRRDADLMFKATSARAGHWGPLLHWWIEVEYGREITRYIRCGGALLSAQEINPRAAGDITYFA